MKRATGFTLIELAVVLAVIAVLAALTIGAARSASRNAGLASNVYEITTLLQGQQVRALSEQRDRVVVFVDAADAPNCRTFNDAACGHLWVIAPETDWTLSDFASSPSQKAAILDTFSFASGVKLSPTTQVAGPAPFSGVKTFDPDVVSTCDSGLSCVAIRYSAGGEVSPVFPSTSATKTGVGVVLASDLGGELGRTERYRLVVGVPTGVTKYAAF